jgi:molybdopterin-guanine dinucleotide biosynthesis protein A
MDSKDISAAIIAGGPGKRMGGLVKSKIIIDGETIISRMIKVIGPLFSEVLIITNYLQEFSEFGSHRIVSDIFREKGPLGGIHSAMINCSGKAVFVFAGDMPFISSELIKKQVRMFNNEADALVPRIGKNIEPLHSIYRLSLAGELEKFLSEKHNPAVRDFLSLVRVRYMDVPDSNLNRLAFTNINTPEDLTT